MTTTLWYVWEHRISQTHVSWWRHQMETFSALLAICAGIHRSRWFRHTKTSDAELWCFFDVRLNKRLSKQSWGWWFETTSHSLWRLCNVYFLLDNEEFLEVLYYTWRAPQMILWRCKFAYGLSMVTDLQCNLCQKLDSGSPSVMYSRHLISNSNFTVR